ncbi:MAG: ABC transporter permease, partial [Angelakisella sp.]
MEIFGGILRAIPGAASQGVLWGIMTLGVYLTYKVLGYSDLTVDGSFATGGAVSAMLIMQGMNPFVTLIFATAA